PRRGSYPGGQREELRRMTGRFERPAERGRPLLDLRVRGVAGHRDPGHVALDVGHEDRHPGLRQLAGEDLERLGLAGPGRAGDEAVPVHHRERDLHPRRVVDVAVDHRAAEGEGRFGERVALGHLVAEGLVHRSLRSRGWAVGRRAAGVSKRIIGSERDRGDSKEVTMKIESVEGIGPGFAAKLTAAGVATTDALLERGGTSSGRDRLSESTGISEKLLLEWVNHADLMRISGVGSEYADLL